MSTQTKTMLVSALFIFIVIVTVLGSAGGASLPDQVVLHVEYVDAEHSNIEVVTDLRGQDLKIGSDPYFAFDRTDYVYPNVEIGTILFSQVDVWVGNQKYVYHDKSYVEGTEGMYQVVYVKEDK